jgi:hypothetical protein
MAQYFSNLEETLKDVPPENIFNYDETALSDDSGRKKVLTKGGVKYVDRVMNLSKSATSILFCGSEAGQIIPPYVVYKAEHLRSTWSSSAHGPRDTK